GRTPGVPGGPRRRLPPGALRPQVPPGLILIPSREDPAAASIAGKRERRMTERKPPGVSWESWIDQQIREARDAGAFENLPGAGKPLPDLDQAYDPDWWAKKLVRREGISVLPPGLELIRKVEAELARIWTLPSETEVGAAVSALNAEIAKVNAR